MKRRTYWAEQVFVMFVRLFALAMILGAAWITPYFMYAFPHPSWTHYPIVATGVVCLVCGILLYLSTL